MTEELQLIGSTIYLRRLAESDVTERYVQWLNDPETNRFMEFRFTIWTMEKLIKHMRERQADTEYFFAICMRVNNMHIGNIKLGSIDWNHLRADIGLMIGDRSHRMRGLGTEAVRLVTDFAFTQLKLQKLTAGAYIDNVACIKAFEKCGFRREGRLKEHACSDGKRVDVILLGCTAADFSE
jgi:ribosomal-protein-alanine N-acetyltransferase